MKIWLCYGLLNTYMKTTIISLMLVLFVSACSGKTDSDTPKVEKAATPATPTIGFVREVRRITLDTNGSYLVFTNASTGRLSCAITWMTGSGHMTDSIMPDVGFFKKEGWFVYVETSSRVWMFDGVRQLDLITDRGRNAVTMPGVFETCPQAVWDALPESVRKLLHDKKPN